MHAIKYRRAVQQAMTTNPRTTQQVKRVRHVSFNVDPDEEEARSLRGHLRRKDKKDLRRLLQVLLSNPATGEAPTMTLEQRTLLMQDALKALLRVDSHDALMSLYNGEGVIFRQDHEESLRSFPFILDSFLNAAGATTGSTPSEDCTRVGDRLRWFRQTQCNYDDLIKQAGVEPSLWALCRNTCFRLKFSSGCVVLVADDDDATSDTSSGQVESNEGIQGREEEEREKLEPKKKTEHGTSTESFMLAVPKQDVGTEGESAPCSDRKDDKTKRMLPQETKKQSPPSPKRRKHLTTLASYRKLVRVWQSSSLRPLVLFQSNLHKSHK
ncbi:expressed unknown protein [Seminavis robusta]|uniref:Uncharacterized protein n=1 Tax=Seminavis robusta TaxID=568900 RepID=A0A9N8ET86_9STRA|nr:expressed unknown protein [Seminavis robusta]|eukprot:Sro1620_g286520.1 n/a (325) ;mRNA; r:16989-17963